MPSLYLGKVGDGEEICEIHAVTKNHGFRELPSSSISDVGLYNKMLHARYTLLSHGKAIYCTAVAPDVDNEIEYNPHDDREGTVHIIALTKDNDIEVSVSVAVDVGSSENGSYIGVPLENRWRSGDYEESASLDDFRSRYVRLHYHEDRDVRPYELAELYRHFKRYGTSNTLARIGIYCGCYHLMVREARNKQKTPTHLWVFDAIRQYFNLYRYAGAAVLRDPAIQDTPVLISPSKKDLTISNESILLDGKVISRGVSVPIPLIKAEQLAFEKKEVPFLDGIIDIFKNESAGAKAPDSLQPLHYDGFNDKDKQILYSTLSLIGRRSFSDKPPLPLGRSGQPVVWDFSDIGV